MPIDSKSLVSTTIFPYYKAELSSSQLKTLQYSWFQGEGGILFGFNVLNTNLTPIMYLEETIIDESNPVFNLPWEVIPKDCFVFVNGKKLVYQDDYLLANSNRTIMFSTIKTNDFIQIYNLSINLYQKLTVSSTSNSVTFNVGNLSNNIFVFRNGVLLRATTHYSYSNPNLTIFGNPQIEANEIIEVYTTSTQISNITNLFLNNSNVSLGYTPTQLTSFYPYLNGIFLDRNSYVITNQTLTLDSSFPISNNDWFFSKYDSSTYASSSNRIFSISPGVIIQDNSVIYLDHSIELVVPISGEYYILFKYIDTNDFPNALPIIGVYTQTEFNSLPTSDYVKLAKINNGIVEYVYTNQREVKRYTFVGEYNTDSTIKPVLDRELSQGNYMIFIENRNTTPWNDNCNVAKLKIYNGSNWVDIIDFSNAQRLDNMHARTTSIPNSIVARDENADITTRRYISTVTINDNLSPLQVASTHRVDNLNTDYFDNKDSRNFSTVDHTHHDLHFMREFSIKDLKWKDFTVCTSTLSNYRGYLCGGQNTVGGSYTNKIYSLRETSSLLISLLSTTLSNNRSRAIGVNNIANGYIVGGGITTLIDKFNFNTETNSTLNISLDNYGFHCSRLNSLSCGYIFGGENSSYTTFTNRIYSLNFVDDSFKILTNYLQVSITLPNSLSRSVGMGKHSHGYLVTGCSNTSTFITTKIEQFIYGTETISSRNVTISSKAYSAGVYNLREGYIVGGQINTNNLLTSSIHKLDYLTETFTSISESLTDSIYGATGINSQSTGYICGGSKGTSTGTSAEKRIYQLKFNVISTELQLSSQELLPTGLIHSTGIQNSGIL